MKTLPAIAAAACILISLSACSNDQTKPEAEPTESSSVDTTDDEPNQADEDYVLANQVPVSGFQSLGELAETHTSNEAINDLGAEAADEREDFTDHLNHWFDEWDLPIADYAMTPDPDFERLETLEGTAFDELWIELMKSTIDYQMNLAEEVLDEGDHAELHEQVSDWVDLMDGWRDELEELEAELP